jgi:hypothetical protein
VLEVGTKRADTLGMRSHSDIVKEFGASKLYAALADRFELHQTTPQRWADRDSIPGEYWKALSDLNVATLEELAEGANRKRQGARAA